ncbi:MAG TPA: hypothetical protein VJN96_03340 [Vicinamibacterales bacterium]|nr:hypothetical protein [Vicinamibacterales bacterium]
MTNYAILLGLGIVACMPSIHAQTHPDFAGTWALVHQDDVRGEPLGAFGEMFVATQSSTDLTVDWHSTSPAGRGAPGKLAYRAVHSTFPFDGTESNITTINSSGSVTRIMDTAGWDDGRLVINTTWQGNLPAHVSRKLRLSVGPEGLLIAETSTPPEQAGGPWSTVQSRYRRLDRR